MTIIVIREEKLCRTVTREENEGSGATFHKKGVGNQKFCVSIPQSP
jgi:hypothetical protein